MARRTRLDKIHELHRLIHGGPSFNFGAPFAGENSLRSPEARKAEAAARETFRLWAASWIEPLLDDLVPGFKEVGA